MNLALQTVGDVLARYGSFVVIALEFLAAFVGVYLAGRVLLRVVTGLLATAPIEPTFRQAVRQVLYLVVLVVGFSFAATVADLARFVDVTGPLVAAVTLAIGFASRDIVANLVSGAFIVTDPKFRVGDWIEWEGSSGVIEDITFRVTRVRTFSNELITVPNSKLVTSSVTNAVDRDKLRITTQFRIGYDDDLDAATSILLEAAADNEEVVDDPEPEVRVVEINDSRVSLQVRVWIADPDRADFVRIRSEYLREVRERIQEAGIELPPSG